MIIVDTHCHTGTNKYEPIESLIFHMEQAHVSKAVLIQHAGNTNNSYHVQCLHSHPNRFASAMIVEASDTGEKIGFWAEQGIVGIRLHADSRSKTIDPLAHWRAADKLNLVVSVPCSIPTLLGDEFSQVLKTFPDLTIVIEHLGGANHTMKPPYQDFKSMLALSRYPNLLIKLPGFGEFCRLPYPFTSVPPMARMVVEAFSPQRVMWGSDYPPVSTREGYNHSLEFPLSYFSDLGREDREWIFGRTALSVWGFSE